MQSSHKFLTVLAGAAACAFAAPLPAQTNSYSTPVGFITLRVKGTTNGQAFALSFLGLGMVRSVDHVGTLEGYGANYLVDTNAVWATNQFAGTNGSFCVEITSGPNAGVFSDIVSNGATNIVTADNLASLLSGGESFRVNKNWTLGSLFGDTNSVGLGGGTSTSADEVLLHNPILGTYSNYYYQTSGLGGRGWRLSGAPTVSMSNTVIGIDQGVLVRRKTNGDVAFALSGTVKLGQTVMAVETNLVILGNVYPVTNLTLGGSGLYTTNDVTGLVGGTSGSADLILTYSNGQYYSYYYQTNGLGGIGWRLAGSPTSNRASVVIEPGTSVLIQRKAGRPPFNWRVPQPFTVGN